jgi:hypothetical protein
MSSQEIPRDLVFVRRSASVDCDDFEFLSLPGAFRPLLGDMGWAGFVETWSTLVSLDDEDEVERWDGWYRPYLYLVAEEIPGYRSPRRLQGDWFQHCFQRALLASCWMSLKQWHVGGVRNDPAAYLRERGMEQELRQLLTVLEDLETRSPGFIPETFTFVPGPDENGWPNEWTSAPKKDVEALRAIVGR